MASEADNLRALLREAVEFLDHIPTCDLVIMWDRSLPCPSCTCGLRELMLRVEDALAEPKAPRPGDGDDDGN